MVPPGSRVATPGRRYGTRSERHIGRTTTRRQRRSVIMPDALLKHLTPYGPKRRQPTAPGGKPCRNDHPNVETVNRMTEGDLQSGPRHVGRSSSPTISCSICAGPDPQTGRLPPGSGGFSGVLGSWFEATNGRSSSTSSSASGRRVGGGVGARHAGSQRQDARVAQRLRVPVRGRSHRRDVDVPRCDAGAGRGVLRLTWGRRTAIVP
jgi:hypothetical protein